MVEQIDQEFYFVNQVMLGRLQKQSESLEFEGYAKLLYEIIRVDIGKTVLELAVFDEIKRRYA